MNMQKKTFDWHGRKYYLLGTGRDGETYYLEEAHWDCEWYWGGGYVETFTNKRCPHLSADISSHQHFDWLFLKVPRVNGYDAFKSFFAETPLTDKEIWKLIELMQSFYIARKYSDMLYTGGAHYTSNPAKDTIQCGSGDEYNRINKVVIPNIMEEVYTILRKEN